MRSLILISVYLSKDLFNRWLETPGAVLARVLIAVSLCLLFLFMSAGFSLTEQAMQKKIESFDFATMPDERYYGGIMYFGAHTGRFSGGGGNLNLQNLPRDEMFGVNLYNIVLVRSSCAQVQL